MAEDQPTNPPADQTTGVKPTNESEEAKNTDSKSFNWKAAAIASAATVGLALIVLAIVLIVKHVRKKKEEDKDKNKNDKEAAPAANGKSKPQKKIFDIAGEKVVGTLGEDGAYHIKRDQLKGNQLRNVLQNKLTSFTNSTNNTINTTMQQQDEYNRKISELSKDLDATKAKLTEQLQQKSQVDQLSTAIGNSSTNIIDYVFSKINQQNNQEENLPAAPKPENDNKEDIMENIEPKEIKNAVTTSLEVTNKAKEEAQGNSLS